MSVLLLRLAAPLQSWGTGSRFVRRNTDRAPSKSGIIGLLAAARGHERTDTDALAALRLGLRIGVRVEQPGQIERDFQTAHTLDGTGSMPLSYRFYLADAAFLVAIQGEPELLDALRDALDNPTFPLYLGRRSCPPATPLVIDRTDDDVDTALRTTPWQASKFVQRRHPEPDVRLDTVTDCPPDDPTADLVQDEPLSFDPRERRYGWRSVVRGHVLIPNPHRQPPASSTDPHQPMELLEGSH